MSMLTEAVLWFAGLCLVVMLAPLILTSLFLRISNTVPRRVTLGERDYYQFMLNRAPLYLKLHEQVLGLGFQSAFCADYLFGLCTINFQVYHHPIDNTMCTLSSTATAEKNLNTIQAEFSELHADGSLLDVNNNSMHDSFPITPMKTAYRYPSINDIAMLYQVFGLLSQWHGEASRRVEISEAICRNVVEQAMNDEFDRLRAAGWLIESKDDQLYRWTTKGAISMAYKNSWPFSKLVAHQDIARCDRALKLAEDQTTNP